MIACRFLGIDGGRSMRVAHVANDSATDSLPATSRLARRGNQGTRSTLQGVVPCGDSVHERGLGALRRPSPCTIRRHATLQLAGSLRPVMSTPSTR